MSVAAISSSPAASRRRSRVEAHAGDHAGRRGQLELERVDGVEDVLLVLLQVLVVGERQRVQHAVHGGEVPDQARGLRAQELGGVGVLLLGHDRGARAPRVGQLAEAELAARPQHELGAEAREVGGAGGGSGQVVEHEVAPGDGVDRVGRHVLEAELAREHAPVGVEVDAGERAGAERQRPGRALGEGEARAVALEHPEVREQMVAEVDGLGALQVRVAGHRPVGVLAGRAPAAWPSARRSPSARRARARLYIERGR